MRWNNEAIERVGTRGCFPPLSPSSTRREGWIVNVTVMRNFLSWRGWHSSNLVAGDFLIRHKIYRGNWKRKVYVLEQRREPVIFML